MKHTLVVLICLLLIAHGASARRGSDVSRVPSSTWTDLIPSIPSDAGVAPPHLPASAVATTLVLGSYKFDSGLGCTAQGWTTVDLTQQPGDWWHVDNFTTAPWANTQSQDGITHNPIQGSKSLWMAAVPPTGGPVNVILCGYTGLPGYGNNWNQAYCSKNCLNSTRGPTPNLDIAFKIKFDSEPSYDGTTLEYTTDCTGNVGWTALIGGTEAPGHTTGGVPDSWTGGDSLTITGPFTNDLAGNPVVNGPVKVRLHFTSDLAWSDQDGADFFGVAVDSLSWEGTAVETFEGAALNVPGAAVTDWQSCNTPGFGNYLALFKKDTGANHEDPCLDNITCYWAAINGSTTLYGCGNPPQPAQKVVPYVNTRGQYLANEIWSPVIPFSGSGSEFRLRYKIYRDLPLDNLIFNVWHVRTFAANGCPGPWKDRGEYYYGDSKDWSIADFAIGTRMDFNNAVSLQVAIGVIDLCPIWCGIYGNGTCHSPAPYIDSVQILRVNVVGPQWDVRSIDLFQDTFATDGTLTGSARVDAAIDVAPATSPTIAPGDSAVVLFLVDPKYVNPAFATTASGLLNDPTPSTYPARNKTKNAVYGYFTVQPFSAAKIGQAIESQEGGSSSSNRYPWMGNVVVGGRMWAKVRMDYTYIPYPPCPPPPVPCEGVSPIIRNRFNIDINDVLFTPGDTISYFFGATSLDGTTYYSSTTGASSDINAVAASPMEVTILPAGGYRRGGNILYVDGADDTNTNVYYDGVFENLGIRDKVDRFDSRASGTGGLFARVKNVPVQLNGCYKVIIWDTGSLSVTLGDGTGDPIKADDYAVLNTFLGSLTTAGGVLLAGDRLPQSLNGYPSASAVAFRQTYMPFTLINDNHRKAPTSFQISPTIVPWPFRLYDDSFTLFGGCPELNDFDVIGASGTSRVEMSYNAASNANGAVVSNTTGNAHVIMAGFSVAYIRDNELDGIFDRAAFVDRSIWGLGVPIVVEPVDGHALRSSLEQNYPNPFNPQTTIAFSIAQRANVRLAVYNVNGALVRTLANETRGAGPYNVTWDGRDEHGARVSSGVYFYKLTAGSFTQTRKMVLLK